MAKLAPTDLETEIDMLLTTLNEAKEEFRVAIRDNIDESDEKQKTRPNHAASSHYVLSYTNITTNF